MRWQQLGVLAAAVACMSTSAMAQLSAIGNAGFEVPVTYDVPPAVGNWVAFFGGPPDSVLAAAVDTTQFFAGAQSLRLAISGAGGAFCGVQQPVTGVQSGLTYTIKFRAKKGVAAANGVEYRVEWKNIAGGFLPDPNGQFANNQAIQTQLNGTWQEFTWTGTAPAEAANANIVFAVQTFTIDPLDPQFNTEVFIDNVEFALAANQAPQGSCCVGGGCTVTIQAQCASGSVWTANGTCSPNTCAGAPGACCNKNNAQCAVVSDGVCSTLGGEFKGPGSVCSPNPCTVTVCRADFDQNGARTIDDIFIFLNVWFQGCP